MSHPSYRVPGRLPRLSALIVACVLIISCGAPASTPIPAPPLPTEPLTAEIPAAAIAVLAFVEGDVTVELGTAPPAPASALELLSAGTILSLAANSRADLICFDNRALSLVGPLAARIDDQQCQGGAPLPENAAERVRPDAGRIHSSGDSLLIEGEAREKEGDYGRIPILLSPRNTAVLEPIPELRWVEVPGAIEYVAHLSGPTAFADQALDAVSLSCLEDPRTAPNRVCSAPWPAEWRLVQTGKHFLTLGARLSAASELRSPEGSWLKPVAAEESAQMQAESATIRALGLDAVTCDLLLGGLYAGHELYGQAIAAYESALSAQPAAVLYVTLGDLYRQIELFSLAHAAYDEALAAQTPPDEAARAAAEFGLGQVYYAYQGDYAQASEHFAEAVHLYRQIDAAEELTQARKGLDEARRRLP